MTDDPRDRENPPPDGDDIDTGRPVEILSDLEREPRSGFLPRLRRRVERRSLTSQIATIGWQLPKFVLFEFLGMLFELFSPAQRPKGGSS